MSREDYFVLEPQHDILIEAIRTNEYGGCVCGVGDGIDLRLFYGISRKTPDRRKKKRLKSLRKNWKDKRMKLKMH